MRTRSRAGTGWHSTKVVSERTGGARIELPAEVRRPFQVFVNGVPQEPARDYDVIGSTLVFRRSLAKEGRLGFWRWLSIFLGIAGTYRQNDAVDVVYERDGRRVVASDLPIEGG